MNPLHIEHYYYNYDFYRIVYGREFEQKALEVSKFSAILDAWKAKLGTGNFPLHILEPFSGASEHQPFWQFCPQHDIASYTCMDIAPNDNPNVVVGDIRKAKLPTGVNLVLAYYYSLQSAKDDNWKHTRKCLKEVFENIYAGLKSNQQSSGLPSAFVAHVCAPIESNYPLQSDLELSVEAERFAVPTTSKLWSIYGADPYKDSMHYVTDITRFFRRSENTIYECHENSFVEVNGEKVQDIIIEKPFTMRPWTIAEMVDIAVEVGFKCMMFNSTVADFYSCVTELSEDFYPNEDSDFADSQPTEILFYL